MGKNVKSHKRKHVKKSKKSNDTKVVEKSNSTSAELIKQAEEYLDAWKVQENWSFKKGKQLYLIRWMYRPDVISKEYFAILVEYLEKMQGSGKQRLLMDAQKIIEKGQPEEPAKGEASKDEIVQFRLGRRRYKRALRIAKSVA